MTFEQEIENEARKHAELEGYGVVIELVSDFKAVAQKARELTLKELGVSDPKEVMSRFLHEQRMAQVEKQNESLTAKLAEADARITELHQENHRQTQFYFELKEQLKDFQVVVEELRAKYEPK